MDEILTNEDFNSILQKYIQNKSGLRTVSPGDCKQIVLNIEKTTGKALSETTLKRFFGFAKKQFSFSKFTLNALCEYAGFEGWEHFSATASLGNLQVPPMHTLWEEFRVRALAVTRVTQMTLQNLAGIPYPLTISRNSAEADFKLFLESKAQLFCLTGVPGTGKTLQLVHLVDQFFLAGNAPYQSSIVWFIRSGSRKELASLGVDIESSMEEQFKIGESGFLDYFRRHQEEVKGKLVLIIDGMDELITESPQLDHVFDKVINLLGYFNGQGWLKIILSLRISTWQILQSKIDQLDALRKAWFSGIFYQKELMSNITPLTKKEIDKVLGAIQKDTGVSLYPCNLLYLLFRNPYYLSIYYYLLQNELQDKSWNSALFCLLVLYFIKNKLHTSRLYLTKDRLLKKLIRLSEYGIPGREVEKRILLSGEDAHLSAYYELLNDGILQEINKTKNFDYRTFVTFSDDTLYTYFLSLEVMEEAKDTSDEELMKSVLLHYSDAHFREILLKWIIWHRAMSASSAHLTTIIFHEGLSVNEQWNLLNFTCDFLINGALELTDRQKKDIVKKSRAFIAIHFTELTCLNKDHEGNMTTLFSFAIEETDKACLLVIQAMLAMLRLDKQALWQAITDLRKLDKSRFLQTFPIDPISGLEFVYHYYTMEPVNTKILTSIHRFISDPSRIRGDNAFPESAEILSYHMGIFILSLCRKLQAIVSFTEVIEYVHPRLFAEGQWKGLTMHLQLRKAFGLLRMNQAAQVNEIIGRLQKDLFNDAAGPSHITQLLEILKGETALIKGAYSEAILFFKNAYVQCKHHGFTMLQIYVAIPLIKAYKKDNDFSGALYILEDIRKTTQAVHFPIEDLLLKRMMESV